MMATQSKVSGLLLLMQFFLKFSCILLFGLNIVRISSPSIAIDGPFSRHFSGGRVHGIGQRSRMDLSALLRQTYHFDPGDGEGSKQTRKSTQTVKKIRPTLYNMRIEQKEGPHKGSAAERSRGLVSSIGLFGGVQSNPTAAIMFYWARRMFYRIKTYHKNF